MRKYDSEYTTFGIIMADIDAEQEAQCVKRGRILWKSALPPLQYVWSSSCKRLTPTDRDHWNKKKISKCVGRKHVYNKFGLMIANSNAKLKTGCVTCDEILSQHHVFHFFSFFFVYSFFRVMFQPSCYLCGKVGHSFYQSQLGLKLWKVENVALDNSEGGER